MGLQQQFLNKDNISINASMDTLMSTKLQSLQSELTELRLDVHSKNNELLQCRNEGTELKQQNEEQQRLIDRLENDLTKYIQKQPSVKQNKRHTDTAISIDLTDDQTDEYSVMTMPRDIQNEDDE